MEEEYKKIRNEFLPRNCCEKHSKWDARTVGLFKQEWVGSAIYACSSKTYFGYSLTHTEIEKRTNEILSNMALTLEEQRKEIEKLLKTQKYVAKGTITFIISHNLFYQ